MNDTPLLNYDEACAYMTCRRRWLQKQVSDGRVTAVHLGSNVRFTKDALDELISTSTQLARQRPTRGGIPSLAERKRSAR